MFHIGTGLVQPASMACLVASVLVVEPVMVQAEPPAGQAAIEDEVQPEPAELWEIRGGSTILRFDNELMEQLGLRVAKSKRLTRILPDPYVRRLSVKRDSTLTVEIRDGSVAGIAEGEILHIGHLTLVSELGRHRIGDIAIAPLGDDQAIWGARSREGDGGLMLVRTKVGFDGNAGTFTLTSAELRLTPAVAAALGDPLLAQVSLGTATVRGIVQWVGGSLPQAAQREEATAGGVADVEGGDMTFCQLYGLYQPTSARLGDIVGLSVATTSWNIGTADLMWFPIPDEEHPFIVMNMYRLKNDRIEMIGMSEIKHGFYALGSHQCGGPPCGWEPGHGAGDWLGTNCTDTYSAPLNAMQYGMGPKYEANPWTGDWYYPTSHMANSHSHDPIQHRIQVHDADLDPLLNEGAQYFVEGFYVMADDINVMNSAAWQPAQVLGQSFGVWEFQTPFPADYPNIGFGIDAWPGATQTIVAQEVPVREFISPDGRCVLAAKGKELPEGGVWHYEYAMLNIDMDRQVGSFSIPLPPGTTVTNVGFYAVEHDEPYNTMEADAVAIDNAPWDMIVTDESVTWRTTTNPIRWASMYNFRFDADVAPGTVTSTVGMFRPGTPSELGAETVGPVRNCPGDTDNGGSVDVDDLLAVIFDWGTDGSRNNSDIDGSGLVDVDDLTLVILNWGPCGED